MDADVHNADKEMTEIVSLNNTRKIQGSKMSIIKLTIDADHSLEATWRAPWSQHICNSSITTTARQHAERKCPAKTSTVPLCITSITLSHMQDLIQDQ